MVRSARDDKGWVAPASRRLSDGETYFGLVMAPSEADETKAAYFPNTPVG